MSAETRCPACGDGGAKIAAMIIKAKRDLRRAETNENYAQVALERAQQDKIRLVAFLEVCERYSRPDVASATAVVHEVANV